MIANPNRRGKRIVIPVASVFIIDVLKPAPRIWPPISLLWNTKDINTCIIVLLHYREHRSCRKTDTLKAFTQIANLFVSNLYNAFDTHICTKFNTYFFHTELYLCTNDTIVYCTVITLAWITIGSFVTLRNWLLDFNPNIVHRVLQSRKNLDSGKNKHLTRNNSGIWN